MNKKSQEIIVDIENEDRWRIDTIKEYQIKSKDEIKKIYEPSFFGLNKNIELDIAYNTAIQNIDTAVNEKIKKIEKNQKKSEEIAIQYLDTINVQNIITDIETLKKNNKNEIDIIKKVTENGNNVDKQINNTIFVTSQLRLFVAIIINFIKILFEKNIENIENNKIFLNNYYNSIITEQKEYAKKYFPQLISVLNNKVKQVDNKVKEISQRIDSEKNYKEIIKNATGYIINIKIIIKKINNAIYYTKPNSQNEMKKIKTDITKTYNDTITKIKNLKMIDENNKNIVITKIDAIKTITDSFIDIANNVNNIVTELHENDTKIDENKNVDLKQIENNYITKRDSVNSKIKTLKNSIGANNLNNNYDNNELKILDKIVVEVLTNVESIINLIEKNFDSKMNTTKIAKKVRDKNVKEEEDAKAEIRNKQIELLKISSNFINFINSILDLNNKSIKELEIYKQGITTQQKNALEEIEKISPSQFFSYFSNNELNNFKTERINEIKKNYNEKIAKIQTEIIAKTQKENNNVNEPLPKDQIKPIKNNVNTPEINRLGGKKTRRRHKKTQNLRRRTTRK